MEREVLVVMSTGISGPPLPLGCERMHYVKSQLTERCPEGGNEDALLLCRGGHGDGHVYDPMCEEDVTKGGEWKGSMDAL